jgi:hypothetical protein
MVERRKDRRRRTAPKRNQLSIRITDKQLSLLTRYIDIRDLDSEADAIRKMINGLEGWLDRQAEKHRIAGSAPSIAQTVDSGLPSLSDGASDGVGSDEVSDGVGGDVDTPLASFAGRPSIGLPNASWSNDGSED